MIDTSTEPLTGREAPRTRILLWFVVGLLAPVAAIVTIVSLSSSSDAQTADIGSQGTETDPVSIDGATLQRAPDGIRVRTEMPTPTPGSYEYPTADMVPPGSPEHPEPLIGSTNEPETYTLWVFIFNHPELCTDACNDDDLDPTAPAKGGVYQGDGRIANQEQLILEGGIRIGQQPARGSTLENPFNAEIHIAIAPHGKALEGRDLARQLNGPIGNPTLWWAAAFPPP